MASAAASLHTHKYSNVSNPSSEPSQEPIYQNQAELGLLKEPIYQNLPAHDKLIMQGPLSSSTCPTPLGADDKLLEDDRLHKTGHVSRVAITNSREDLSSQHTEYIQPHEETLSEIDAVDRQLRKKSVTKINIGNEVADCKDDKDFVEQVTAKSPPKKPARLKASGSQSVENLMAISDDSHLNSPMMMSTTPNSSKTTTSSNTPRTPSSKPRAGRKRWAFNFGGSKTGSLKSLKSLKSTGNQELGADDDNHKK